MKHAKDIPRLLKAPMHCIGKKWVADFPSLLAPHFHSLLLQSKEGGKTINFDCFNEDK
jgi:hypothetical protein